MKKLFLQLGRAAITAIAYATIGFIILITVVMPVYVRFFWPD